VRGNYLVFDAEVEQIEDLVWTLTVEHEQVLDHELVLSVPPDFQSFRILGQIRQIQ